MIDPDLSWPKQRQAELNQLGARFASWARSHGYPPASYGRLGRGWAVGSFGTSSLPGDPSFGEIMRHSHDHATWYVLEDGTVKTSFEPHQVGLPDLQQFIGKVRSNWGCDLAN